MCGWSGGLQSHVKRNYSLGYALVGLLLGSYINKPRCKYLHAAMKDAVTSITVTRDTVPVKANFLSLKYYEANLQ